MEVDDQHYVEKFSDKLLQNIMEGRNRKVDNALQKQANLYKMADRSGWTLLHYASKWRNEDVADSLVKMGADVDAQDQTGKTPLMISLDKLGAKTVEILLKANANIYIADSEGRSSLDIILHGSDKEKYMMNRRCLVMFLDRINADCSNAKEVAESLINANCHINHVINWNKPSVTRCLLEAGYPVNCRMDCDKYETALHVAIQNCDLENVKVLLDYGAHLNAINKHGQTPFMYFRSLLDEDDNLAILELLLSKNADMNRSDVFGRTGMAVIFQHGAPKVVSRFLQHRENYWSQRDSLGYTPLHYLVMNIDEETFREVEWMKFDINILDNKERTPLHLAVSADNPYMVNFLLKNGTNVNAKDVNGCTPFYYALTLDSNLREKKESLRCLELLLQWGADMEYEGDESCTVFDLIRTSGNRTFFRPILMHLAIREALGTPVRDFILKIINSNDKFKREFGLYKRNLKSMQMVTVYGSVTLFKLLTESQWKIMRYVSNPYVVDRLVRMDRKCNSKSYCFRQLRKRVKTAIRIAQLQQQAASVIGRLANLDINSHGMILDRIVEYLREKDMMNLLEVLNKWDLPRFHSH